MSFDAPTRNRLAKLVGDVRTLLTDEFFEQCRSVFGIAPSGAMTGLEHLGDLNDAERASAILLRARVTYLVRTHPDETNAATNAVTQLVREQAFTVLNRFAALRMAEKRGLVAESVGRGYQSKGFKVFETVARTGLGDTYHRYRQYLLCLFDELALDLGVLFDGRSPHGLLFPRETTLLQCLDLLNAEDVDALWAEDETIGWVYQYYNDPSERKKMREESTAPRDSRELAVRNQFFTPRYVVEFLSDNTLGRIWYESTQGRTKLKERCRYLVRRPNETFLKSGEIAPAQSKQENVSHEELEKRQDFIPHRPLKDPRTMLMLDPACGSMHFGLYAFDLFETIYEEAWELEETLSADALSRAPGMRSLHDTYPVKNAFLKDVPRLIVQHNLHGIDIDPRCTQIAGLSLWLRAQKAWQRLGITPGERPIISRSNIVCAEPMPGDKELLREFVEREFPTAERNFFLRLLEGIFDQMQRAGEAGSLLKIEGEIRNAISDAKQLWKEAPAPEQSKLFTELEIARQGTLAFDLSGITDEQFWETAEARIYAALRDYAEQAEHSGGFHRRLFAEDAARGFAFIDVCRKRYDVVVMNPPFGEVSRGSKPYVFGTYPHTKNDLFACFSERWVHKVNQGGRLGAITSRSGFFFTSFQAWREKVLLAYAKPIVLADLGYGVLDSAMVETAAYVLEIGRADNPLFCFRLLEEVNKGKRLDDVICRLSKGQHDPILHICTPSDFRRIPGAPFAYWVGERVMKLFADLRPFAGRGRKASGGIGTTDDFRFIRCWWEVPQSTFATSKMKALETNAFVPIALGGRTSRFYAATTAVVKFGRDGLELKTFIEDKLGSASRNVRGQEFYFRPGLTWPLRGEVFSAWPVPAGCVFSVAGKIATTDNEAELPYLLGMFNSLPFDFLVGLSAGKVGGIRIQHQSGLIDRIPFPEPGIAGEALALLAKNGWSLKWRLDTSELRSLAFTLPALLQVDHDGLHAGATRWADQVAHARDQLEAIQSEIDAIALNIYGLETSDVVQEQPVLYGEGLAGDDPDADPPAELDEVEESRDVDVLGAATCLVDYLMGSVFGRWDIRFATGEKAAPESPDPFAPLPSAPPGQLQNAQGVPVRPEDVPAAYPVRIPWDGILVDEPNHPLDIERRVREINSIIWKDRAEAIEQEASGVLGVQSLRDYWRKPTGFFADHLKRYSKSRRQAPIYWPLSSAKGSYTLWVYYHRLTDQTLHTALADFIEPKIRATERALTDARSVNRRQETDDLADLLTELQEFRAELERVIRLPWKPNLNDGVLITASPIWKLFRFPKWQRDLKSCWEELASGEYDWAHLALSIWPDRVRQACQKDRSVAIAHGLEHLFEGPVQTKKPAKSSGKGLAAESA